MREDFLYYLWENRLLDKDIVTSDGDEIQIVSVGMRNHDAGPDYLDAKIRIGDTLWAGHVEMHVNASDWFKHGHQNDEAYENVILHVVYVNDCELFGIPTIEVMGRFDESIYSKYKAFMNSQQWVSCGRLISGIQQFTWLSWLERVIIERLEEEVADVNKKLAANNHDWEETVYQRIMRSLGLKVNNEAFEWLSRLLPLKILRKHLDNPLQIEAMFFGCAGFLEQEFADGYPLLLQREFKVLKSKFDLITMPASYWKFLRLRPPNFPTIRLAQMAAIVQSCDNLLSKMLSMNDINEIRSFFDVEINDYWTTHFLFDKPSKRQKKSLGSTAVDVVLINAVVPVLFCYGACHDNQTIKDRSLAFLEEIKSEDNLIIRNFTELGVSVRNAQQSQALIHLYTRYCRRRRCLECRVFNAIIKGY